VPGQKAAGEPVGRRSRVTCDREDEGLMNSPQHRRSPNPPCVEPVEQRVLLSGWEAHVNFQPGNAPKVKGYVADVGGVYKNRGGLSFGWSEANTAQAVDRNAKNSKDQRYDTFNQLAKGRRNLKWEIAVPDGLYQVRIVAGDAKDTGNVYRIKAEGKMVVNRTIPVGSKSRWASGALNVTVKDGRLTIVSGPGAVRNKICFIDIVQLRNSAGTFGGPAFDATSGAAVSGGVVTSMDPGDWIRYDNVLFGKDFNSIQARLAVAGFAAGQSIEFRADSPDGTLLGTLQTEGAGDGSALTTQSTPIDANVSGVHDLYVVFKGSQAVGQLDFFRFSTRQYVEILALGDSITEGRGGHDSYRRELWQQVEAGGYSVDFVGTRFGVRPNSGEPTAYDWDMNHEAISGRRTDELLATVSAWGPSQPVPDVVLIHLGSNDLMQNQSAAGTANEIGQIIDVLRARNANVKVLVAKLAYAPQFYTNAQVDNLNDAIVAMVADKDTGASPVAVVDQNSGFDPAADTFDGLHPIPSAEATQANRWFAKLKDWL
jgi:lysophospholipase L1-like esterase